MSLCELINEYVEITSPMNSKYNEWVVSQSEKRFLRNLRIYCRKIRCILSKIHVYINDYCFHFAIVIYSKYNVPRKNLGSAYKSLPKFIKGWPDCWVLNRMEVFLHVHHYRTVVRQLHFSR